MDYRELNRLLGNIDIYLLDLILKGRLASKRRLLDAGCGEGRNLVYLIAQGFDVYAYDRDVLALKMLRQLARQLNPAFDVRKIIEGDTSKLLFPDLFFDVVISSAVLHFAEDTANFWQQLKEIDRVMDREAILFIRMASNIGLTAKLKELGGGRYVIPDGSARFLLTRELIQEMTAHFGWELLEPVKTTNVQDVRCMTTLVLRKC